MLNKGMNKIERIKGGKVETKGGKKVGQKGSLADVEKDGDKGR